jgi:hypothetical protein
MIAMRGASVAAERMLSRPEMAAELVIPRAFQAL